MKVYELADNEEKEKYKKNKKAVFSPQRKRHNEPTFEEKFRETTAVCLTILKMRKCQFGIVRNGLFNSRKEAEQWLNDVKF